jgi:hypothetical protein
LNAPKNINPIIWKPKNQSKISSKMQILWETKLKMKSKIENYPNSYLILGFPSTNFSFSLLEQVIKISIIQILIKAFSLVLEGQIRFSIENFSNYIVKKGK